MIILFFLILLLALAGFAAGTSLLGCLSLNRHLERTADHAIVSVWAGIVVLANILLGISLFNPLSATVLSAAAILLIMLSIWPARTRKEISAILFSSSIETRIGISAIALGVAVYCSQVIVWYDSGLYHIQFIKWLSNFGLVPGLALIHWRLGIASSWFAIAAPLNHGILEGRIYSLPGGFCLFMMLSHLCLAWRNVLNKKGLQRDFFIIAAIMLALPVMLVWGMPNSPTPDFPVIALEIVTAWLLIIICTSEKKASATISGVNNVLLVPIVLAAGAASIKLSAMPLLAIAYFLYVFKERFSISRVVAGMFTAALLLLPLAAAGLQISGCFFFPSTLYCIDTPSSLGASLVAEKSKVIMEWAKWGGAPPPPGATGNWLPAWLAAEKVCASLIVLSLISTACILLSPTGRMQLKESTPVLAAGILGPLFMLATAPSWRFGLGYLVLPPALAIAQHVAASPPVWLRTGSLLRVNNIGLWGTLIAMAIALHSYAMPRPSFKMLDTIATHNDPAHGNAHFNLQLPPKPWDIRYELDATGTNATALFEGRPIVNTDAEFTYFTPNEDGSSEVCWDAPLPCAPNKLADVKLLDPGKGIAGGFVKITR